ncbi:MAG TPA: hypothetical protein VEB43_13365 [Anaeromyxobacter sp.]|nr:hypothetical protein [Anaeromyxobacter sp.]
MILTIVAVLLASMILTRNLPRALRALRAPGQGGTGGVVAIVNVLLAFAILVTALIQSLAGAGLGR